MPSRLTTVLAAWAMAAAVASCHAEGHAESGAASAWLELPVAAGSSETMLPFSLEDMADAIALGRIGEPLTHQGRRWIRLDVEEVLSGPLDLVASQLPALIEAICSGRREAQSWFLERLRLVPERAVEPLARAWSCLEPTTRASAVDYLSSQKLEPRPNLAPPRSILLEELDREDLAQEPYVYSAVVRSLGALGGPEAVERLRRELSRREGPRAIQVLQALGWACGHESGDPCTAVRRGLLELLVAAAHDPAGSDVTMVRHAVQYLVEIFDGEDTRARLRGIVAGAPESPVAAEIESWL